MERVLTAKKDPYRRLAEINRAITSSLKFDEVLDLIVKNAAELVDARITALLLLDKDGLLRIRAVHGLDAATVTSFAGRMEEDVIRQLHDSLLMSPNEVLESVPIIANQVVTGLLLIANDKALDKEEEWQLSALADQAAIALTNARLHEMELAEASRERDLTLEALRESNEKVNSILESITDLFYSLDREWRFTDINRQAERRMGSREQLIGRVIWEVYPAIVNTQVFTDFHRAMAEMTPVHFEISSLVQEGGWFEVHAYPSEAGLTVYLRDISERKNVELRAQHLASIVQWSDDAIISKDLDGIIRSWNRGAERVFGYTAAEAVGQSILMLIPKDRVDEEAGILQSIRQGRPVDHFETIRRRKDGTLIDISLTASPVRDVAGRIVGASKIARDIGDRKRREAEIRFQANLLNAVEQAVIATDLEGKITYWNSFAESLYGWDQSEVLGRNVLDVTPADNMRHLASEIFERMSKGESWSGEFETRRKDGSTFPALVTDSPIFDRDGKLIGIVGVSVDITASKQAEDERSRLLESERQARTEAEAANRLKDEFLATLSHELRNPLNVILGYSEVLLRSNEAQKSPFIQRTAETLRRNALAQAQLVRDLLDLSRLRMGKMLLHLQPLSLPMIITNAVETVRSEAEGKNLRLWIDIEDDKTVVVADSLRLEQVIWNLLNNAVKFTPAGGEVSVSSKSDNSSAVIEVNDTGQGIDPEFLPHIWEMFRQADASTSRRYGGMGIGLALVNQLVELHHGSVAVSSEGVGKGARFTIRIPLAREKAENPTLEDETQSGTLAGTRILVVDDSADTIEMLRRLLEMDGAVVTAVTSGQEGLTVVQQEKFDVILSDISMPEMDGFEFVRTLRALPQAKNVPVLALTGFGRSEDVERARREGFFSHVTKPIDPNKLTQLLKKIAPAARN